MNIKKAAIAVGHTASGTAGCGAVGYKNESNCTREICPVIVDYLSKKGIETKLIQIDKSNSYEFEDCYERARIANEWGADIYVEIHLNAFDDESAHGTEAYVISDSSVAVEIAKRINKGLVNALGTFDRTYGNGYKTANYIVLRKTNMPAVLIETLFCTNKSDADKYNANTIGKAIAAGILNMAIEESNSNTSNSSENSDYDYSCKGKKAIVTGNGVRVRDGAGIKCDVLGHKNKGDEITLGYKFGEWYNFYYGDHGGWIHEDYVRIKPQYGVVTAKSGLKVRDGAGIKYDELGALPYGKKVEIGFSSEDGKWHNIYFGDHGGWVSADYIRLI
ncbi:N-acetylmuramoyl-L-alanine amidase [Fusobacterium varium]